MPSLTLETMPNFDAAIPVPVPTKPTSSYNDSFWTTDEISYFGSRDYTEAVWNMALDSSEDAGLLGACMTAGDFDRCFSALYASTGCIDGHDHDPINPTLRPRARRWLAVLTSQRRMLARDRAGAASAQEIVYVAKTLERAIAAQIDAVGEAEIRKYQARRLLTVAPVDSAGRLGWARRISD